MEILPCAVTHRDTPAGRFLPAGCGAGSGAVTAVSSAATDRSASRNRSTGGRPPHDWCGRAALYSLTHPSSAACNQHRPVPLLHHTQLHQHTRPPLAAITN
jgi:hypothetical protein